MTSPGDARPGWSRRLPAAACYLGLAPLVPLVPRWRDDAHVRRHRSYALAVWSFLFLLLLLFAVSLPVQTWAMIRYPDLLRRATETLPQGLFIPLIVVGVWALANLVGAALALAGSARALPGTGWLARRRWVRRFALAGYAVTFAATVVALALALHASSLVRDDGPAPVYVLYDNQGYELLGDWGPELAAYRVALAAGKRWGPGSVVVAPLGRRTLGLALAHGKFVVLLCHGVGGEIVTPDMDVAPPTAVGAALRGDPHFVLARGSGNDCWEEIPVGPGLRFVYNCACDAGTRAGDWRRAFAPAEVVTFDRPSGGIEHLWWLWFDAPGRVRGLP